MHVQARALRLCLPQECSSCRSKLSDCAIQVGLDRRGIAAQPISSVVQRIIWYTYTVLFYRVADSHNLSKSLAIVRLEKFYLATALLRILAYYFKKI